MSAKESFLQWYQQLSSSEQQTLCDFLRSWLWTNQPSSKDRLGFGGKLTVPATSRIVGGQKIRCPECNYEFEINN